MTKEKIVMKILSVALALAFIGCASLPYPSDQLPIGNHQPCAPGPDCYPCKNGVDQESYAVDYSTDPPTKFHTYQWGCGVRPEYQQQPTPG